ncbi:MAG: MFS transporter, partial [Candidatus Fonsibacter sp.]
RLMLDGKSTILSIISHPGTNADNEQLARATAVGMVVFQVALVSGPVIGGMLIAWQDVWLAYLATGVFALVGMTSLVGLTIRETPPAEAAPSVFAGIRDGLRFVRSSQVMLAAM